MIVVFQSVCILSLIYKESVYYSKSQVQYHGNMLLESADCIIYMTDM